MNDSLASKALTFLGLLGAVALAGALYLTAIGVEATVAWATATGAIGTIGGILVPRD
jgi:hypothetical protein